MHLEPTTATSLPADALQFQGRRYLAGPFNGWSLYRNPTPQGTWSVVQFDANTGQLQVQIGRKGAGTSSLTIGYQFAAWETDVHVDARTRFFVAAVEPEVSVVRPNGGVVTHWAYMELRKGNQAPTSTALRLYPGQPVVLVLAPHAGVGTYRFRVGVYTRIVFQGTATPYGEVIARVRSVFQHTLDAGSDPQLLDLDEGFDVAELANALTAADTDAMVRPVGNEMTAATAGLQAFDID